MTMIFDESHDGDVRDRVHWSGMKEYYTFYFIIRSPSQIICKYILLRIYISTGFVMI